MVVDLKNLRISYETERLTLKTLTVDAMSREYANWLSDPDVFQYLETRHNAAQTQEKIEIFVEEMLSSPDNLMMGIFTRDDGRHIGNIKLGPISTIYKRADIGIIVGDKSCWGKGYATEAIDGLCKIAFSQLGLQRVQAGAYSGNVGSIKAFERAGFLKEAVLRDYWIDDTGKKHDGIILGLLA